MLNNRMTKLCTVILLTGLLTGCGIISYQTTERGHHLAQSDVQGIVKGQTTERDVLKIFGPPSKMRDTDEGKEFLYEYDKSGGLRWNLGISVGGGTAVKTLIVWLDKKGIVTDYAFKQS